MNIKFTESVKGDPSGITGVVQGSLDLCGQGRSRGEGDIVLPIRLESQSGEETIIAPLVSVKTGTTRNKRGTTSALLRVAMPYTAFRETQSYVTDSSGTKSIKTQLVQDATRSGGELSVHTVIAMPAAMVADIAKTGSTAGANLIREAAQKQLIAAAMLLRSITGETLSPELQPLAATATGFSPATASNTGTVPGTVVGGQAIVDAKAPEAGYYTVNVSGYGPGIDMSKTAQQVHLDDALGRIIRGQPALACKDIEIPVRATEANL